MEYPLWGLVTELWMISALADNNINLILPEAGYCGDETILTCLYPLPKEAWSWEKNDKHISINDNVRREMRNKYRQRADSQSFSLIVNNTDLNDEADYRCTVGLTSSQFMRLKIKCKPTINAVILRSKALQIVLDRWNGSYPLINVTLLKKNNLTSATGSKNCSTSLQINGYKRCVWTSDGILSYGTYTCSINVTSSEWTEATFQTIYSKAPNTPVISNVTSITNASDTYAVKGVTGLPLTLMCVSTGGYPAPTLIWYQESNGSIATLNATVTETLDTDNIYKITSTYTFCPEVADNISTLTCRSYYPEAPAYLQSSTNTSVTLYLSLSCHNGLWGWNCTTICGHCLSGQCRRSDGDCVGACQPGYKFTKLCKEECIGGTWGRDCTQRCGSCLFGFCNKTDGKCHGGCQPDYKFTPMCNEECDAGTYGANCSLTCRNGAWGPKCKYTCEKCIEETCDPINGSCAGGSQEVIISAERWDKDNQKDHQRKDQVTITNLSAAVVGTVLFCSIMYLALSLMCKRWKTKRLNEKKQVITIAASDDATNYSSDRMSMINIYSDLDGSNDPESVYQLIQNEYEEIKSDNKHAWPINAETTNNVRQQKNKKK